MTTITLQMAKASNEDIEAAIELCSSIDEMRDGVMPGADGETPFDADDLGDCQRALKHLFKQCEAGSLFRVVWGMSTLLNPANKIVDPDANVLKLHPRFGEVPS